MPHSLLYIIVWEQLYESVACWLNPSYTEHIRISFENIKAVFLCWMVVGKQPTTDDGTFFGASLGIHSDGIQS